MDFHAFNEPVIAEFRANGGKVGGPFEGAPMLLLHTKGARSGQPRLSPLVYLRDGEHYVIIASKAGWDTHPHWYHNLLAHPEAVEIEVGTERLRVRPRPAEGAERRRLFDSMAERMPNFREYEAKTDREIPVIVLERL